MGLSRRTYGYVAIVVAAVLYGIWPSLSKLVLAEVDPLVIAFLIQLIPGIGLSPSLRGVRIARSDWKLVLLASLVGAVAGPILYFYGLERTTAANSVLLSNSESLFTIMLAYAVLGERATRREYVALVGIAVGAFLVTTQLRFGDVRFLEFLIGNAMLVAAAACWGVSNTVSTMLLRRIKILPVLEIQLLIGAAVYAPIVLLAGAPLAVPLPILPILVLLSLSAVGVFSVLFFYAFRTIGAMRTGAVLPTSALWGILLALYLFPNDTLGAVQVAGGALMILALVAFYVLRGPSEAEGETLKPAASDGPESP
ncbi:MAG: DMT family transporter [Methanobacteriota archaeon]|nr:MAG: DMT family transporter [Euryarchaeota archaeon]